MKYVYKKCKCGSAEIDVFSDFCPDCGRRLDSALYCLVKGREEVFSGTLSGGKLEK